MQDVTQLLRAVTNGEAHATDGLLPIVYCELRRLATAKMQREKAGHTLTSTALVHEAYLRLVEPQAEKSWDNRSHFFAAAAEAMRRILIENARRKSRLRHGGQMQRHNVEDMDLVDGRCDELIALDDALEDLLIQNEQAANLVKLRFFAGLTIPQAAWSLGVSESQAKRLWVYARAWLYRQMYS